MQEKQALFVGAFSGIMLVEPKQGGLDVAKMLRPGMMEVNLNDGAQSAEGRCIITARSGDQVYATWNCTGVHLAVRAGLPSLGGSVSSRILPAVGISKCAALKYKLP